MFTNRLTLLTIGTGAVMLATLQASATDYEVDLGSQYTYGMNDQNYPNNNFGPTACAPTSTVNSFTYLQDRYGLNLIPHINGNNAADDASAAINELGADMNTNANGTTDGNMVAGKRQYIADHGLANQITVEVQADNALADPSQTTPTWQFLFDQLNKGQDVEFGFNWNGGGGHWVTVTGLHFNDANNNGVIDPGEATMDFVDPWGGVDITGNLTMGGPGGNHIVLSYSGGAAGNPADPLNPTDANSGYADIIVAESPVPEPASLTLLAAGICSLLTARRRKSEE